MKITVFGLGYVGCVSAACLADTGHNVIGIDVNATKINLINNGSPTVIEKDLDSLLKKGWGAGRIKATSNYETAVMDSDVSIICVGTPNNKPGHLNLGSIYQVTENIGEALVKNDKYHVIIIRSTVLPGTNEKVGLIIEEQSGKKRGKGFEVVSNPEFLREGSAVEDFYNPPFTVIGTSSERAFEIVKAIYRNVNGPIKRTSIKTAEMIKLVSNSFHALKVTFANEIGNICKQLEIDSSEVMKLFCEDKKLNLSSYYLKPGFAYGGSCLPKDLKALNMIAHDRYVETPVLSAIERSNDRQKQQLVDMIKENGTKKVGILGFSFKPGTDDLRNSPIVEVAEILLGKGYDVAVYDKNVRLSNLIGRNRQYINEKIPHLEKIITDNLDEVINRCELIVVANNEKEFADLPSRYPDLKIIDLVGIIADHEKARGNCQGICW